MDAFRGSGVLFAATATISEKRAVVVVEDAVGKFLHDLADEEGHTRAEIAERVHHELAWPVSGEAVGKAGRCESLKSPSGQAGSRG